jgi:hypothetical protein
VDGYFPRTGSGWKPQVTGGVSYTRQYADKDTFTVGAEYFYNGLGYADPKDYPGVLFLPHHAAEQPGNLLLPRPALLSASTPRHQRPIHGTTPRSRFRTLANLSDKSGISPP